MKHQIINNDLKKFTINFNKFLKKKLSKDKNLLNQAILYSINTGGKRFRPYLVYIFGKELNLSNSVIFNLASAIEMLHNYSLVHDDLPSMDNDQFRRGKKTTHYKFNEYTAILAGCALLTKAYQILSSSSFKISDKKKTKLIEVMSKVSGEKGLLLGQYYDLSLKSPTVSGRLELNKLKTAKLMSYCCQAVAICANKNKSIEESMKKIGEYIGEIFQINDDIADFPRMSKVNTEILLNYKNLEVIADPVIKFLFEGDKIIGFVCQSGKEVRVKELILTTGTFLNGLIHIGETQIPAGRYDEKPSTGLSEQLEKFNFT